MDFHQRLHYCGLLIVYNIQVIEDYCKTTDQCHRDFIFSDYDNYDKENKSKREDCCDICSKTEMNEIKLNSVIIDEQGLKNLTIINISLWYMTSVSILVNQNNNFIQCRML